MPEATIVLLDNSSYSINGDYSPTRWMCQIDAAGLLIQTKLEQSHEDTMGIGLNGGRQVEIICTPSNDVTKVTSYLYGIKLHGQIKIGHALQTAALALKHRANSVLRQRIICFIGSKINQGCEELRVICKKLKKNQIALDIVALGDLSKAQMEKIQLMHSTVNQDDNCTLLLVEPQDNINEKLFASKLIGGGGQANFPQINEVDDPELLLALQLSLQEQENHGQRNGEENNQPENSKNQ